LDRIGAIDESGTPNGVDLNMEGKRRRPVKEGARIYNLFPLLAGPMEQWGKHLDRAAGMGFNWIFINSFFEPGFSGSIYSIKDYYRINPLLISGGNATSPMDTLRRLVDEARRSGLHLIMDLVINHTAVDSPLIREHPEWYLRDADGKVIHPSVREGGKTVTVWGDLAEIDNEGSRDREKLWNYWEELTLFYRTMGFEGFRCDAAYQVTDLLWRKLIETVKDRYPETLFFAETLGCTMEDVIRLAQAGFDYTFNSSKYWDFEAEWCVDQYRENARWAPSVSFAESHDTPRLAAELTGDIQGVRQRYLFSALFSTGVMMPIGFEFGFRKKLHVVRSRPDDWEKTGIDLSAFIREINGIKRDHPVFNEDGPIEVMDAGNPRIFCLKKETLNGEERALILLNKDRKTAQSGRIPSLSKVLGNPSGIFELHPDPSRAISPGEFRIVLDPSGFQVLCAQG